MSLFSSFLSWAKARLHIKATELKHFPGVHDPVAAAAEVNAVVSVAVDAAAAAGPAVLENALKIHPDTLKGLPGISDHVAAADAVNALVNSKLSTP